MSEDTSSSVTDVILVVLSIALFVLAWALFEAGKPGSPIFSDALPTYGVNSGVNLYLPKSPGFSRIATTVYLKEVSGYTNEDIAIEILGDNNNYTAVLELREAARIVPDDLKASLQKWAKPGYASVVNSTNGNQYLIARSPGEDVWTLHLSGRMLTPALNTEQSRTSFVSPKYGNVEFCQFLPGARSRESSSTVDVESFRNEYICDYSPKDPSTVFDPEFPHSVDMEIEGYLTRAARLDYTDPPPSMSGQGTALHWHTDDPQLGFRARASYSDLAEEADEQRYIFASGVVAGIASAGIPSIIALLSGRLGKLSKKLHHRRSAGR